MTVARPARWTVVLPVTVFLVACAVRAGLTFGPARVVPPADWAVSAVLTAVPVVLGSLLSRRVPASPVGTVLSWLGAAPAAVFAVQAWGQKATAVNAWPAARLLYELSLGAWVWNLAGFVGLCLMFPDGKPPGRRWRQLIWSAIAAGLSLNLALSWLRPEHGGGRLIPGQAVLRAPVPAVVMIEILAFGGVLGILAIAAASLVVRYRRGSDVVREQLRWLMLGAMSVPVLLAAGWLAEILGASIGVAYTGFMVAMLVAVPTAVAIAVLRYDLFDVDRLLGATLAWLLTMVLSAAVFAGLVYGAAELAGAGSRLGLTGAAFVAAMCLLPLHRRLTHIAGRLVDRERTVLRVRIDDFVRQVRDGDAQPEEAEDVMRAALGDPGLRLLVRLPASPAHSYVDLAGNPVEVTDQVGCVPLTTGAIEVGAIVLGAPSARRLRRAREVAMQARLPIEVSRLRLELRVALDEVRSSRARLAVATAAERQRLARDLHDGAQQQIIAVGMRLRSVQRNLRPAQAAHRDLEVAVETLAGIVAELRRLAHGLRPSRLEDGLAEALKALAADSPVPVSVSVAEIETSEVVATAVYFVVAEALTNALKHAQATAISVVVAQHGRALRVEVSDDGIGGASPGFGLTSVRDRVGSVGGVFTLLSPAGAGTRIQVTI